MPLIPSHSMMSMVGGSSISSAGLGGGGGVPSLSQGVPGAQSMGFSSVTPEQQRAMQHAQQQQQQQQQMAAQLRAQQMRVQVSPQEDLNASVVAILL